MPVSLKSAAHQPAPARLAPNVIPLGIPPRKNMRMPWLIACAALSLSLACGAAAVFWFVHRAPVQIAKPDIEATEAYVETVTPRPADIIAPVPVLPASDSTALIAVPAASLAPDPPAPDAIALQSGDSTAIAAIANGIKDAPVAGGAGISMRDAATDRTALAAKSYALMRNGDYEAAAAIDRRLLRSDPNDSDTRARLADALGAAASLEATDELQKMAAARPDFAPVQAALARTLVRQNDIAGALPHAERAARLAPENVLYRLGLAVIEDRLGKSSEAIALYRQVLRAYAATDELPSSASLSLDGIRHRVDYLETLMAAASDLQPRQ